MNHLLAILDKEILLLEKALEILIYSYKQVEKIGLKKDYGYEELDKIEAFTARFARTSDMIVQKMLRLIDKIELTDEGSVRDRINRAAKKDAIPNAELLIKIRLLRNQITHEYVPDSMQDIYNQVFEMSPSLIQATQHVLEYAQGLIKKTGSH